MPSIPIAAIFSVQALLVVGVFAALISVFTTQMDEHTEHLVKNRLLAQLSTLRATILEPYQYGLNAAETMRLLSVADPANLRLSPTISPKEDFSFCRYGGIALRTSPYIMFVSQFLEHPSGGPNDTTLINPEDGKPYLTRLFVSLSSQLKTFNGNMSFFFQSPAVVSEAAFRSQPLIPGGKFPLEINPIYDDRMDDTKNGKYWTHYPYASDEGYTRAAVYSITLPNSLSPGGDANGNGLRFHNKWMVASLINLSSITAAVKSLTDGDDSHVSLYDIADYHNTYQIIATTDPAANIISPAVEFVEADETSSPRLNAWFRKCFTLSAKTAKSSSSHSSNETVFGTESDAVRVDGRFLSYTHIRLESALHLFAIVSTPESRYFAEAVAVRNAMVGIGVICAVVIVVVCVFILLAIRIPLAKVETNMGLAAVLKNSEVTPTRSFLSDINSICVSFEKMNKMLEAARAFMPQALLVKFSATTDTEGEDDDEHEDGRDSDDGDDHTSYTGNEVSTTDDATTAKEMDRSSRSSPQKYRYSSSATPHRYSGVMKESKRGRNNSPATRALDNSVSSSSTNPRGEENRLEGKSSALAAEKKKNKKRVGHRTTTGAQKILAQSEKVNSGSFDSSSVLKNRRVAVLCVNVRGFTAMPDFSASAICAYSSALLDVLSAAANAEKGVIDSFHGDHFIISFNAAKTAASPARKAVQCSFAISSAVCSLARAVSMATNGGGGGGGHSCTMEASNRGTNSNCRAVSMGAAGGNALIGPLGNATQRRLSIVGTCYTRALRLQAASASLEKSVDPLFGFPRPATSSVPPSIFNCLIDSAVYNECRDSCATLLVGCFAPNAPANTKADAISHPASPTTKASSSNVLSGAIPPSSAVLRTCSAQSVLRSSALPAAVDTSYVEESPMGCGGPVSIVGKGPTNNNGSMIHFMRDARESSVSFSGGAVGGGTKSIVGLRNADQHHSNNNNNVILIEKFNSSSDVYNSSISHSYSSPASPTGTRAGTASVVAKRYSGSGKNFHPPPPMLSPFSPTNVNTNAGGVPQFATISTDAHHNTTNNKTPILAHAHADTKGSGTKIVTLLSLQQGELQQARGGRGGAAASTPSFVTSSQFIYATYKTENGRIVTNATAVTNNVSVNAAANTAGHHASSSFQKEALLFPFSVKATAHSHQTDTIGFGSAVAGLGDEAEEWMYEMQKKTEAQPLREVSAALEYALNREWEKFKEVVETRKNVVGLSKQGEESGVKLGGDRGTLLHCVLSFASAILDRLISAGVTQKSATGAATPVSPAAALTFSSAFASPAPSLSRNNPLNNEAESVSIAPNGTTNTILQMLGGSAVPLTPLVLRGGSSDVRIHFPEDLLAYARTVSIGLKANCNLQLEVQEAAETAAWLRIIGLLEVAGGSAASPSAVCSLFTLA